MPKNKRLTDSQVIALAKTDELSSMTRMREAIEEAEEGDKAALRWLRRIIVTPTRVPGEREPFDGSGYTGDAMIGED